MKLHAFEPNCSVGRKKNTFVVPITKPYLDYVNYLAHLYLSGDDTELLLGNFMADHLKGPERHQPQPVGIRKGIALHRHIDHFTDNHAVVAQSKARVREQFGKYAPVIVDVFYDHFLAARWQNYHHEPLALFSQNTYQLLQAHVHLLPQGARHMLPYMVRYDWLNGYAGIPGLQRVMEGMSRRARFASGMEKAPAYLQAHYEAFGEEFENFFPALQQHVQLFLRETE